MLLLASASYQICTVSKKSFLTFVPTTLFHSSLLSTLRLSHFYWGVIGGGPLELDFERENILVVLFGGSLGRASRQLFIK
jgi:hypothetical protein